MEAVEVPNPPPNPPPKAVEVFVLKPSPMVLDVGLDMTGVIEVWPKDNPPVDEGAPKPVEVPPKAVVLLAALG